MQSDNNSNLQHGSFNSVHTNLRDSTGQDPVAPNLSAGSINEQFSNLNINEQPSASTATNATSSGSTSGSTTIDHDATKTSGHSSPYTPQLPYNPGYPMPTYGHPMFSIPQYGYHYLPPQFYPGYPPFGYPPMSVPPPFNARPEHIAPAPLASSNSGPPSETSSETPPLASVAPNPYYMGPQSNIYFSPKLTVVTSKNGFSRWIQTFILVLKDYDLESLIPDSRGLLSREPTPTEIQSFDSTLLYYVKEEYLPSWFKEATARSANKFQAIQRAMVLSLKDTDQQHLWAELKSLTYNGSSDAFVYISKIRSIITLFPNYSSDSTTSLIKTIIFDSLRGPYTSIVKKYAQKSSNVYSVEDILSDIQFEYDFNKKISLTSTSSSTRSTSNSTRPTTTSPRYSSRKSLICNYCQKPGHSISQCYTKKNREVNVRNSNTNRKPQDKINNIAFSEDDALDDTQPAHHLRPTSSDALISKSIGKSSIVSFYSSQHLLLDSGSSITLVNNRNLLHDFTTSYHSPFIATSQNFQLYDKGKGFLKLQFHNNKQVTIEAYYVPEITDNILSVSALEQHDVYINSFEGVLESSIHIPFANIVKNSSLPWLSNRYIIFPKNVPSYRINHLLNKYPLDVIHRLFGHVNVHALKKSFLGKTFKHLSHNDIDWSGYTTFQCIDCAQGKSRVHNHIEGARLRYQEKYGPFEFLHSDIFGPVSASSSAKYFITFIDEYSSYRWVFPLENKSADTVLDITTHVVNTINRQFGKTVKAFQFDQGSEYTNKAITEYLDYNGIQYLFTSVGDSRSHGVAERLNLTFLNDCRTLLKAANLPSHLWIHAVQFSAIIRNAIYNKRIDTSPQALAGLPALDVKTILPFGQPVIAHLSKTTSKIQYRGEQGFALCPSTHSRGYLIYIPKNQKIVDTTNYAVLRTGVNINSSTTYDDSIFDTLITSLTGSQEYSMDNDDHQENTPTTTSNIGSHSPQSSNVSVLFAPEFLDDTDNTTIPTDTDNTTIPTDTATTITTDTAPMQSPTSSIIESSSTNADAILQNLDLIPDSNNEANDISSISEPSHISDTTISAHHADSTAPVDTIILDESPETHENSISPAPTISGGTSDQSSTSSNSGGINAGILTNNEKSIFNRKRTRVDDEQIQTNQVGIGKKIEDNPSKKYKSNKDKNQIITTENKRITRSENKTQNDMEQMNKEQNKNNDDDNETKHYVNRFVVNYVKAVENPQNKSLDTNPLSNTMFYNQAITYNKNKSERKLFEIAYDKELTQLQKLNTWDNEPINAHDVNPKRIINSMFIFTIKRDNKHKCRLVARGDQQKDGTYRKELVANTVHHYALMICLSNCLSNNYEIIQLDISSAYLYAELEEELYIRSSPHLKLQNKVFRLKKSLYGLKQSGANWYNLIRNYLTNECDMYEVPGWACVFTKKVDTNMLILCLFVDDIIIFTDNRKLANHLIDTLKKKFDNKIVNEGDNPVTNNYDILGLNIEYQKGESMSFCMGQSIEDKLPKFNINLNIKRNIPGVPGLIPKKEELIVTKDEYKQKVKWMQQVIGLASYVAYKYRFDLLYYINILARYTLYPSKLVMDLAKQLIQYLWYTRYKKLRWFKDKDKNKNNNYLTVISDAAFASQANYKSQYGNYYYLNNNIIGGKSSKSTLTCTSSTEAEIYAISEAIPRIEIFEVLVKSINKIPIKKEIITDSKPSISSFNAIDESRMKAKFFTTRLLRSKEEIKRQNIEMSYIDTKNNKADILTKPVQVKDFNHLTEDWIL